VSRENRALLVDLDGTLADTLPVLVTIYERFLHGFGVEPSMDEFAELNGVPIRDAIDTLRRRHAFPGETQSLTRDYEAAIDVEYLAAPAQTGARELLSTARRLGWRRGVVTSGRGARARQWLAAAGLAELVDVVIAAEDVEHGKPDPEPYYAGLDALGAQPHESMAVEDSAHGAVAAREAGIDTYVLATCIHVPAECTPISGLLDVIDAMKARTRA
jgi:HAD superfamily hydrolase (TIGR01509 family)